MDCVFCRILQKEIPSDIVYEDAQVCAFLDINPVNLGHTLVIPKQHHDNVYELDPSTFTPLLLATQKIARAMKSGLKADGVNLSMNNDTAAGQVVFHAHIHVIPRFAIDGLSEWKGKSRTKDEIASAGNTLRQHLTS